MSHATKLQKFGAALMMPFAVATTTLPAITPQEVQAGEAVRQAYMASDRLMERAQQASKGASCIGVVVSTNAEQEKVQSAADISKQIQAYFAKRGVVALVIPEPVTSFAGDNHMDVCIGGSCERYSLDLLSKDFLNGVIEKHLSSGNVASAGASPSMCHG